MLFCMGSLIEAHVVLTTASCVFSERYKFEVYGGTHAFIENLGIPRTVEHVCTHRGYNHSMRLESCSPDNVALLLLREQYQLHTREDLSDYIMNRLRYGVLSEQAPTVNTNCRFYGWGSRRNGYLIPLLLNLRRVDVYILRRSECQKMWNWGNKYLCLQQYPCKDDLGSVVECSGFLRGMMTSRLIDRPCGIGFLDMAKYIKFLTCGVDDSRDIMTHSEFMEFDVDEISQNTLTTPKVILETAKLSATEVTFDPNDPGPPKLPSTEDGEESDMITTPQSPVEVDVIDSQEAPEPENTNTDATF